MCTIEEIAMESVQAGCTLASSPLPIPDLVFVL
jgi:hypothetical protein